jgi:hypothetical protein
MTRLTFTGHLIQIASDISVGFMLCYSAVSLISTRQVHRCTIEGTWQYYFSPGYDRLRTAFIASES